MRDIESYIQEDIISNVGGSHGCLQKNIFYHWKKQKRQLLDEKESSWRLKSIALWLQSGDENTKFFQAYAKG
jgi:hypothetical protein